MLKCNVTKKLQVVRGGFEDYEEIARFYYRKGRQRADIGRRMTEDGRKEKDDGRKTSGL